MTEEEERRLMETVAVTAAHVQTNMKVLRQVKEKVDVMTTVCAGERAKLGERVKAVEDKAAGIEMRQGVIYGLVLIVPSSIIAIWKWLVG